MAVKIKLRKLIRRYSEFVVPSCIFSYFIFNGINLPYVGQNAYNFIIYSLIAHNYNTIGYLQTKFASVISVARTLPAKPEYFIHHPPLLSIIESVFLRAFGEDFWVGRLSVILFAFGTFILCYFIEKLFSKKFSYIPLVVMSLIPASTLFGKMIGQEDLVLFFVVLTTYLSLKYFKTNNKVYWYLAILAVVLGTLSDWPMTYFSVILLLLYKKHRKIKLGVFLPVASGVTAICLVAWIAFIRSGFWDLRNAVELRSFVGLGDIPYWPILWVGTTFIRLLIYFNPLIVLLSLVSMLGIYKRLVKKKLKDRDFVVIIFLLFGVIHITLYTQASFTHPYLIYYLLPFFTFSASTVVVNLILKRRYIYLLILGSFCLLFLFILSDSKQKQIESGIWRYELANKVAELVGPYETVVYNKYYAIDPDIFLYPLLIPHIREDDPKLLPMSNYNYYVYSCMRSCVTYKGGVDQLKTRYAYELLNSKEAEVYIFYLKKPQQHPGNPREIKQIYVPTHQVRTDGVTNFYRAIRDQLKVPQI